MKTTKKETNVTEEIKEPVAAPVSGNADESLLMQRRKQKKKETIKKIVSFVVFITVVVVGLYGYNFKLKNERWPWQPEVVADPLDSMVKAKVYKGQYSSEIDISGFVEAYDTQTVMIRAAGTVTGVYVEEGDRVKEGQLLAEVDSTSQTYALAQAEWELEKAKVSGSVSAKEISLLEMRISSLRQSVENTKAYANFDGVVASVSIEQGNYFSAGDAVMTIIDDSKLKATVEIDEIDIQSITLDTVASLTSDSIPGETVKGRISYIPMIGRYTNQGIGVMDVEITIDEPPKGFRPGFSFEGTIDISSQQEMLLISQSAVTTRRGVSTVKKLMDDGSFKTVPIQVKYLGENLYQVVGGDVKDGDTVIYEKSGSGIEGLMNKMGGMGGRF